MPDAPEPGIPAPTDHRGITPFPQTDTEVPDADLQAAAEELGFDFANMDPMERDFLASFAQGQLDSKPPVVPGDSLSDDEPLIPDPTADVPPADATPSPTPEADANAGRDGISNDDGSTTSGDTTVPSPPEPGGVPSPEPQLVQPPIGLPAYEIPSPIITPQTAPPPPAPEPTAPQPQYVQLANGAIVTVEQALQLQAQQQAPPAVVNPWEQQPGGDEWVDERAAREIQQLRGELGQFQTQQQIIAQQQMAQQEAAIELAVNEAKAGYGHARGLTVDQLSSLENVAVDSGFVGLYAQHFPNDPRRAVGAALEAAYRLSDEFMQHEIERQVQERAAEIAEVARKRAAGSGTAASSGSVPRTPPAGRLSRADADKGMIAEIESAMASPNGRG